MIISLLRISQFSIFPNIKEYFSLFLAHFWHKFIFTALKISQIIKGMSMFWQKQVRAGYFLYQPHKWH